MENIAHNYRTPAFEATGKLFTQLAVDPANDDVYPNNLVLIAADSPDASVLITRAVEEQRPIALVFPDGGNLVARPPEDGGIVAALILSLLRIAKRSGRRRDRPTFLPLEWVTEFHAPHEGDHSSHPAL